MSQPVDQATGTVDSAAEAWPATSTSTVGEPDVDGAGGTAGHRLLPRSFAVDRFSGLYVAMLLVVVFSVWNPDTFATADNARTIASSMAITGILTLGLIVALLSGMFDVSVAANMTLAIMLVGWLQSSHGMNALLAVILTLAAGAAVGASNAFVITKLRVEPVVATLGMSSVLAALAYWISDGKTIIDGISTNFEKFGSGKLLTIPVPVFYLAGVALVLWFLLEHTPTGRYMYASGANAQATRLAGVNVLRLSWLALIITGVLASFAGIVLTMQLGGLVVRRGRLVPAPGVRRRLPRRDAGPSGPVQRGRHTRRPLPAGDRGEGPPVGVPRPALDQGPLRGPCAHLRRGDRGPRRRPPRHVLSSNTSRPVTSPTDPGGGT